MTSGLRWARGVIDHVVLAVAVVALFAGVTVAGIFLHKPAWFVAAFVVVAVLLILGEGAYRAWSEAVEAAAAHPDQSGDVRAAVNQVRAELTSVEETATAVRELTVEQAATQPLPAIAWGQHHDLLSRTLMQEDFEQVNAVYERANQITADVARRAKFGETSPWSRPRLTISQRCSRASVPRRTCSGVSRPHRRARAGARRNIAETERGKGAAAIGERACRAIESPMGKQLHELQHLRLQPIPLIPSLAEYARRAGCGTIDLGGIAKLAIACRSRREGVGASSGSGSPWSR